tara:strand:- start:1566 stop:3314 length:1749 start_codon:yes stop_codon:yes gene_type:complete
MLQINTFYRENIKKYYYGYNSNAFDKSNTIKYLNNYELFNSADYIKEIFDEILSDISSYLNNVHSKKFNINFWKILISPWLLDILMITYERKYFCNQFLNDNKFTINFINPPKKIDYFYKDLFHKVQTDDFNEYLLYEIIKTYSKNNISETIDIEINKITENKHIFIKSNFRKKNEELKNKYTFLAKILNKFQTILIQKFFKNKKSGNYLFLPSFNFSKYLILFLRYNFKFYLINTLSKYEIKNGNNFLKEKNILINTKNHNFKNNYTNLLIKFLPLDYLEHFRSYLNFAENFNNNNNIKKMYVRSPIETFPEIRFISALISFNKKKIFASQHGGQYNNYPNHPLDYIEKNLCDKYFVWSKKGLQNNNKQIINIGCTNLNWKTFFNKYNKNGNIIIIGSPLRRYYGGAYSYSNYYTNDYLIRMKSFLDLCNDQILKNVVYRSGWNFGVDINSHFKKYKNLSISKREDKSHAFELISKAKLSIINYNSTTWLQLADVNFPFILFLDSNYDLSTCLNKNLFKQMEKNNLLFYDPKKLYLHINQIDSNILQWWNSKNVQKIIVLIKDEFINKFSITKFKEHFNND